MIRSINYPLWSNKLPQVWWLYKTQMYHLSFFECEGCIHIGYSVQDLRKLYYNCNPGCYLIWCSWCSSKLTGCYRIQCLAAVGLRSALLDLTCGSWYVTFSTRHQTFTSAHPTRNKEPRSHATKQNLALSLLDKWRIPWTCVILQCPNPQQ